MKSLIHRSSLLVGLIFSALLLATPMWAATGNGFLTVSGDGACGSKPQPEKWDVLPDGTINLHIQSFVGQCVGGPLTGQTCDGPTACSLPASTQCTGAPGKKKCQGTSISCTTNAECQAAGACDPGALECAGDGPTYVIVKGHAGFCTSDADCTDDTCGPNGVGDCQCDEDKAACEKQWWIPTEVPAGGESIDVSWTVDSDMCFTAAVAYCGDPGLLASEEHCDGCQGTTQSGLRAVAECSKPGACSISGDTCFDGSECKQGNGQCTSACSVSGDVCATDADCAPDGGVCEGPDKFAAIEVCGERDVEPCTNEVGSNCCGLTQGAYGAPNSIATAACSGDCTGCGFIPAAQCNDCDPFFGDPNGTTAGIHETHAVSLDNLQTLIAYLPSGGTAGCFNAPSHPKAPVGPDTHYSSASEIPDLNKSGTNSNGQGGGVLAGQAMATRLNAFLSSCPTPFGGSETFTYAGFGGFQIPADGSLVCTKTSGPDKDLGTPDDVCAAFAYPACTAGLTISTVLSEANNQLALCSNDAGCSATELVQALDNANRQFDNCGEVVECVALGGTPVTAAGTFTCP